MHLSVPFPAPAAAVAFLLGVLAGCGSHCSGVHVERVGAETPVTAPATFSHERFDEVLRQYVDADGLVDYAGLQASGALAPYLRQLAATDPSALDTLDQVAFWINAYNALTLKLITDNYPVKSIRRLTPVNVPGTSVNIPKVNSPFLVDVGEVGGVVRTLDEIEHDVLRTEYDEPRIHFALVCAALSCPALRREAYAGDRLGAQLDDQARRFLHDPEKNQIPADEATIRLSKIFSWFRGDFASNDSALQAYLAPYFEGRVRDMLAQGRYKVEHLPYDWTINDQAGAVP